MTTIDVAPILARYGHRLALDDVQFLGQAGGLSGALFWRISSPDGPLCLRRWPAENPSVERLRFIHAVLLHSARAGIDFTPMPHRTLDGETFVDHDGYLWELTSWLTGTADYSHEPNAARRRAAMIALATWHQAVESFEHGGPPVGRPPGVADRHAQLDRLDERQWIGLAAAVVDRDWPAAADRCRRIVALAPQVIGRAVDILRGVETLAVPLAPCLRDVWHENVLFEGNRVTGLVDFGAMRVDNVAIDVARLLGSMAADDAASWREGLLAYESVRPLSADERLLVAAYDTSGVLLGGINWVRWLYQEERTFEARHTVIERLDYCVARLTALGGRTTRHPALTDISTFGE